MLFCLDAVEAWEDACEEHVEGLLVAYLGDAEVGDKSDALSLNATLHFALEAGHQESQAGEEAWGAESDVELEHQVAVVHELEIEEQDTSELVVEFEVVNQESEVSKKM